MSLGAVKQSGKGVLLNLIGVEQDGKRFLTSLFTAAQCSQQASLGPFRGIALDQALQLG